ncbi:hypothetical protein K504DRAFT_368193 [Pleomassaria siparia CBS 279.74]|uniref:Zn(2)-C6 fungal-type domain-containing protein n=1 Tax=Pleomassaria siparia CBS 279.74 TaxID=1314801 RepID=A0A6G1KRR4_9PLEO|nr:hypothetical protein K504DRAFT_368193 [Pleomassaria siparia CBS 279.74]
MVDIARSAPKPHSSVFSGKPQPSGGRQRIIASCLTCRRRKVRCDHGHPICGACTRGNHTCHYATDQGLGPTASNKVSKPVTHNGKAGSQNADVQARLDRLELLLERAVLGQAPELPKTTSEDKNNPESQDTPSSTSQISHGAGISSDNNDGTLLLSEKGQYHFVSSLHYALLADEIQDIKALLGNASEEEQEAPTRNNLVHLLSLGRAKASVNLQELLPETEEHRGALLDIYFSNVDPMVRLTHKPTLIHKFPFYIQENHPLAFAVFYSAINSLSPSIVEQKFGYTKEELTIRFELGVEIGLARANYLTTSSLEIFQGFLLWLTCISAEDDIGKAWALLGIAIRIALNQGLHRDPSLFPSGSMDTITIESRRRAWHQVCNLEFRAAECKGQEPSISDDSYTAMLPRNIEDDELIEGASPGPNAYDEERFTSMTFQLVRFVGMAALRRIVQSTYRLERRMLESGLHGTIGPDPATELQDMYEKIKIMVDELRHENERKYLRFCDPDISIHRITLGLASMMEWRCYLIFWLRMPRAYRDVVFSNEIRTSIFEKSVKCIETLNGASADLDMARYQWHIGGHAAFQAILHILSELRNPLFDVPDRQRALQALRMFRFLKENNHTKAWSVVKGMIDKALGEVSVSTRSHSETPGPYTNTSISYLNQIPAYAYEKSSEHYIQQPALPLQQMPPEQPAFNWDDLNYNNIVGDVQQNIEVPEFDWGFWGDPVNFGVNEPITLPMDETFSAFPTGVQQPPKTDGYTGMGV